MGERSIEEFSQLIQNVSNSVIMQDCFSEMVEQIIAEESCVDNNDSDTWQVEAACDMPLLQSATSFIDALKQNLKKKVIVPLANIIHKLEKLSAWHSFFSGDKEEQDLWKQIFLDSEILSLKDLTIPHGPEVSRIDHKPMNYKFPFSQIFWIKSIYSKNFSNLIYQLLRMKCQKMKNWKQR